MHDELKAALGREATFSWLGVGAVLFYFDASSPGLVSWQAALFLGGGMFVASIVVALTLYGLLRALSREAQDAPSSGAGRTIWIWSEPRTWGGVKKPPCLHEKTGESSRGHCRSQVKPQALPENDRRRNG